MRKAKTINEHEEEKMLKAYITAKRNIRKRKGIELQEGVWLY